MVRNSDTITTKFLDTNHNPSFLRSMAQLEIDVPDDDEELDKIVATEDALQQSAKEAAQDTSGKKESAATEPVASGGDCCAIL